MAAARKKAGDGKEAPLRPAPACPICGKEAVREFRPFCSRRCANIDLNRWLSGGYAIPATEEDDPEAGEGNDDDA